MRFQSHEDSRNQLKLLANGGEPTARAPPVAGRSTVQAEEALAPIRIEDRHEDVAVRTPPAGAGGHDPHGSL